MPAQHTVTFMGIKTCPATSRVVRDINPKDFPLNATYMRFDGDPNCVKADGDMFFVTDGEDHANQLARAWKGFVEVPAALKGKIWVVASTVEQLAEQNRAA